MIRPHVLVTGPHGVIGGAVTALLGARETWRVSTVSRRPSAQPAGVPDVERHVGVDLLDETTTVTALDDLTDVTHLVAAAYTERATTAETAVANVAMLRHTLDGLRAAGAALERVVLIGGGKSYGEHLGPYATPAKETDPRHLGPLLYNGQEDLLSERSAQDGFAVTVLRPDVVVGVGLGSPMSLVPALGVYAALCREHKVPLRFPGSPGAWSALHQCTDADLLAAAVEWALGAEAARGEVFNVTNGDQFRWQHLWPEIAEVFEMPTAPPQPMSLTEHMPAHEAAWDALVRRHDLRPTPYRQLAAWPFADGVLNTDYDMVQSTIKIRQAGFHDCIDSHESITGLLRRMRQDRLLP